MANVLSTNIHFRINYFTTRQLFIAGVATINCGTTNMKIMYKHINKEHESIA